MNDKLAAFERILTIMDDLRAKCPWDRKQTWESLRNLTIEETYELADAIMESNVEDVKEELGDVLLHIVFYAKIAEEKGYFDIADVIHVLSEKLIKRHPHIYGDIEVANEEEVMKNWEQIKMSEGKKSVLEGVPVSLPAMIKAVRMQEKTAKVGFEWENSVDVWLKVEEEMDEVKEAVQSGNQAHIEEEMGDLFFALINYARFQNVDPETALEKVNKKFKRRFEYIEAHASKSLEDMTLEEMDGLWNQAKAFKD